MTISNRLFHWPFWANFILVSIAAILHAASWLDERLYLLAWPGLGLLFWSMRSKSTWKAISNGFYFGCVMLGLSFHWATLTLAYTLGAEPTDLAPIFLFVALILWESVPFAVLGWLYVKSDRGELSLWVTPLFWVLVEAFWPRVFPWCYAHSQSGFDSFVQAAELGGAILVSFVFVAGCVGACELIANRNSASLQAKLMIAATIVCAIFGFFRKSALDKAYANSKQENNLSVLVVQVDPNFVDSPVKMRREIDRQKEKVDLVLLPESTLGTYSTAVNRLTEMIQDVRVARLPFINIESLHGIPSDFIVGGKSFHPNADDSGPYYQTAFLINSKGEILTRYFKRYLLPIGEYAPFESVYPELHEWVQLGHFVLPGESNAPVTLSNGTKVGVLVCYEDIIPDAARNSVAEGAEVLVCIINGSAFESSFALTQHRRLAMLRSVENRRPFLRSAATGPSCYISPTGELLKTMPCFEEGSFQVTVPRLTQKTVYSRGGYLFPYLCMAALVICFGYAWFMKPSVANKLDQRLTKNNDPIVS